MKAAINMALKRSVFEEVKFLSDDEQIENFMELVVKHINIPNMKDDKDELHLQNRIMFKTAHQEFCIAQSNDLRSCVQTQMKKEADADVDQNGGKLPPLNDLMHCASRKLDPDDANNHETILFCFDNLLPKAPGLAKHFAPPARYFQIVSVAKTDPKADHLDIAYETEALCLLLLVNNYDKWVELHRSYNLLAWNGRKVHIKQSSDHAESLNMAKYCVLDVTKHPKSKTKCSISNVGQDKLGGWSAEGLENNVNFHKVLCNVCKKGKALENEKKVLKIMRDENDVEDSDWAEYLQKKGERPKTKDKPEKSTGLASLNEAPDSDDDAINFEAV